MAIQAGARGRDREESVKPYSSLKWIDLLLRRWDCALFGHDYEVWQQFTPYSRRIYCENCQRDWGMNDDVQCVVPWDAEIEDMYRTLGFVVRPRRKD